MSDIAKKNTDKELWRENPDDYYSPSIHVTSSGGIGIGVGGLVFVMPIRDWHALAKTELKPPAPDEGLVSDLESLLYEHTDESASHKTICEWIRRIAAPRIRAHVEEQLAASLFSDRYKAFERQKQRAAAQARLEEAKIWCAAWCQDEGKFVRWAKSHVAALEAALKGGSK